LQDVSFLESGVLKPGKTKVVYRDRVFDIRKDYEFIKLQLDDNINQLEIPNFGSYLYGDLTSKGEIYKSTKPFIKLSNVSFDGPKFNISYIYYSPSNKKGCIATIDNIELKILQTYEVKVPTNSRPSIKISKNKLVIDTNIFRSKNRTLNNTLNVSIPRPSSNVINSNQMTYSSSNKTYTIPISTYNLNPSEMLNFFKEYTSKNKNLSGKIFGKGKQNFNLIDGGEAYLTLNPFYTLNIINKLFFTLMYELNKNNIKKFNEINYFIYENLLNKIYYSIKYSDPSFEESNILKIPIIYTKLVSNNNSNLNSVIKKIFNSRRSKLSYYDSGEKLTTEEYRKIPAVYREAYKKADTENVKKVLAKIYYMSTYIRPLNSSFFSQQFNELDQIEITVSSELFDL